MCWTEDNRMQAYVQMNEGTDKGRAAYYGYNTSGERYVRYIGTTINITQNGITFHRPILQSPVLYANSLITLNGKGYTKHYFEGDRRVCSKLGGGFTDRTEDDINDRIQPIEGEYDKLFERQYTGIKETFANCIGTDMEFNLKYDPYKTIMENELGRDEDEPAFYYQGDHLGSSAYLTDEAGAITQTLNYLPYGEDWVDVHNNPNYLSRYKYNGKEKDPESGLHYYGARYYDSDISQWLSIDPMADKYPSLSPYNYCADNPVILVDPDGREIGDFYNIKMKKIGTDGIDDGKIYIVRCKSDVDKIKLNNKSRLTTQLSELANVPIELPNEKCRRKMVDIISQGEQREYGGLVLKDEQGEQFVRESEPSPIGENKIQLTVLRKDLPPDGRLPSENIATFHSHYEGLGNFPSPRDYDNAKERQTFKQNYLFTIGSGKVHFYTSEYTLPPMSIEKFKDIKANAKIE